MVYSIAMNQKPIEVHCGADSDTGWLCRIKNMRKADNGSNQS